jgi:hypothetical protein
LTRPSTACLADATVKIGAETSRAWGRPLAMPDEVVHRIEDRFGHLFAPPRRDGTPVRQPAAE